MSVASNAKCALGAGLLVLVSAGALFLAAPEFSWRDDFQSYQLAGYCDAARAWRNGELPLLSPSSWNGGALLGEYQNAVFSPAIMVPVLVMDVLDVPLGAMAAVLAVSHLALLAAGCALLARQKGLSADLSLLVALVGAFNGYQLVWGALCWFPELASFAWVPWFWWALERSIRRPGPLAWLPAAAFLALIVTAGWPFSVLMTALITLALAVRHRPWWRKWRRLRGPALAWAVGLGLSAPAWLALVEFTPWTVRGQIPLFSVQTEWLLSPRHLPALLFPGYRTPLDVDDGPPSHFNAELLGALVPVIILAAARWTFASWRFFGRFRTEAGLAALCFILAMLPGFGPFRWSFRWLALVFLACGLAAAGALERLRVEARPANEANLGLWALTGVVGVWVVSLARGLDPTFFTLGLGAAMTALCLAWAALERFCPVSAAPRRWAPALLCWAVAMLFAAGMSPFLATPVWSINRDELARQPLEPGVRYWSAYTGNDMVRQDYSGPVRVREGRGVALFPANLGMFLGVDVVQGYSPLGPLGLRSLLQCWVHGQTFHEGAWRVLRGEAGPDGLLQLMAIDGLLLGEDLHDLTPIVQAHGWREVGSSAGVRRFRRLGPVSPRVRSLARAEVSGDRDQILQRLDKRPACPLPPVLYRPGAARSGSQSEELAQVPLWGLSEGRNRAIVQVGPAVDTERDSVIAFSRPWYPGYQARLNGHPVPVEVLALSMPAVRLAPGSSGTLVLEYRPLALTAGGLASVLTAGFVACAVAVVVARRAAVRRP